MTRDRMPASPGEVRTGVRARTAGDIVRVLEKVSPGTPVTYDVRDIDGREIDGIGLFVETSRCDRGGQSAWLSVDVGVTMPTRQRGRKAEEPLEDAWQERSWWGDCPLQAVASLVSRHDCTPEGCIAFGTRQCYAKKWRREWVDPDAEMTWTDRFDDEGEMKVDAGDEEEAIPF